MVRNEAGEKKMLNNFLTEVFGLDTEDQKGWTLKRLAPIKIEFR